MAASALTLNTADHNTCDADCAFEACNVDGNYFDWGAKRGLLVANASGGALTIKIDNPNRCGHDSDESLHDQTHTVPDGKTILVDVSAPRFKNAGDSNRTNVTYPAGVASLTISLIELGGQN